MARTVRVGFEEASCPVMPRVDHREAMVRDDADREIFLQRLAELEVQESGQHLILIIANHLERTHTSGPIYGSHPEGSDLANRKGTAIEPVAPRDANLSRRFYDAPRTPHP